MSTLNEISQMVITGQIRTIKAKVQQALDEGIGAQEILDGGLLPGINEIGEKFARNEVFVPNVLLAAKVMNMGVEVIQPLLAAGESARSAPPSSAPLRATCTTSARTSLRS